MRSKVQWMLSVVYNSFWLNCQADCIIKCSIPPRVCLCCSCWRPGSKVIPGFGIHPWWAHLHASSQGSTWQDLLEAPSPEQLQQAVDILRHHDPVTNSGAYATNRPASPSRQGSSGSSSAGSGNDASDAASAGSRRDTFDGIHSALNTKQHQQQQQVEPCLGSGLRVVPQEEWQGRLRQLLTSVPGAIVGGERELHYSLRCFARLSHRFFLWTMHARAPQCVKCPYSAGKGTSCGCWC